MGVKSRITRLRNSKSILNLLFIPVLLLLFFFIIYPFIRGTIISFTNWNGYSQHYKYVGLDKYALLFSDKDIVGTIINTIIYAIGSTIFLNVMGLFYALLLDKKIRGSNVVRTIIYLPVMISGLIIGYIWYFIVQFDGGAINDIAAWLGHQPLDLLTQGKLTVLLITAINVLQYVGFSMILYLAGLQTIPKDYFEAAAIDGAKGFSQFRSITLPLLMPSVTINIVLNIIGGLKLFDVIIALTGGGPGYMTQSLSTMMYQLYFSRQDAGQAAALGDLMFFIITVISITTLVVLRKKEVEY